MKMFSNLPGHVYKLKSFCVSQDKTEYEEEYLAVVSRNTKPNEKPWRMTIYSTTMTPGDLNKIVHIQLDSEYAYLEQHKDGDWVCDVIEAVQEYVNSDCIYLEPYSMTEEELQLMLHTHR